MSISLTTANGVIGKLFKSASIIGALCASIGAQAAVIDFEAVESPIVFDGQRTMLGDYYIDSYGESVPGSLVGTIGDNSLCSGFGYNCPTNNNSNYYNVLADSIFVLSKSDNQKFKVQSFDASFVGDGQPGYQGIAGAIELIGFDENNQQVSDTAVLLKDSVGGQYSFANFNLGEFGAIHMSYMLAIGYAYDETGFTRNRNRANFAIDNITTYVPEPGSFALFGLGLLGLGAFSRRRSA